MLKQFNFQNHKISKSVSSINSANDNDNDEKKGEKDGLDIFLTLLLKNFSSKERYLLLNKLLTINWSNTDEYLENYLQDSVTENDNSNEKFNISTEYDQFLWDFNNWKNYFISNQEK